MQICLRLSERHRAGGLEFFLNVIIAAIIVSAVVVVVVVVVNDNCLLFWPLICFMTYERAIPLQSLLCRVASNERPRQRSVVFEKSSTVRVFVNNDEATSQLSGSNSFQHISRSR